jgi:hypothetical protein
MINSLTFSTAKSASLTASVLLSKHVQAVSMDIRCLMVSAFNVPKHQGFMEPARVVVPIQLELNLHVLTAYQLLILTLSFIQEDAW